MLSVFWVQPSNSRKVHARKLRVTKSPIYVPVSPSSAVECYPCREVPLNYSESFLFHGGDTGSTPVRDAKTFQLTLAESGRVLRAVPLGNRIHQNSSRRAVPGQLRS